MEDGTFESKNVGVNATAEKKVLVWVTSPLACKNIMIEAKSFAEKEKAELVIVSIQSPITDDWRSKARDLEILDRTARGIEAQLNIEYSDNPLKSAFNIIRTIKPMCMFTGVPGIGFRSAFVENICQMGNGIPVYTVDKLGNSLRVDTLSEA